MVLWSSCSRGKEPAVNGSDLSDIDSDVQFLPIAGLLGTNMKARVDKSICSWWNGPCLFDILDCIEVPLRDPKGPVRMPIIDKYKYMGTVVMGKIESGTILEGDIFWLCQTRPM